MLVQNWLKTWWLKVPHPRVYSVVFAIVYITSIITGVVTLFFPPHTLLGFAGEITVSIMGVLLLGCGSIAAYAGTKEAWRLERVAIYGIMLAVVAYLVTVVHYAAIIGGNWYTLVGVFVLALLLFVVRLAMIWRFTFNPRG